MCCVPGNLGFPANNNILSGNMVDSNPSVDQFQSCTFTYTISSGGTIPSGPGNSGVDPMFVSTTDEHLKASSPASGAAAPNADLTGYAAFDLDDKPRTAPADLGAYVH